MWSWVRFVLALYRLWLLQRTAQGAALPLPLGCRVPLASQPLGQPRPESHPSAPAHINGKSRQQQKEAPPEYPWPPRQQPPPVPAPRAVSAKSQQQEEAPPKYHWPPRQQPAQPPRPVPKSRAVSTGKAACAGTDTGVVMAGKGNGLVYTLCGADGPALAGSSVAVPSAGGQRSRPVYPKDHGGAAARAHALPAPRSSPAASANSAIIVPWAVGSAVVASDGAGGGQAKRHGAANHHAADTAHQPFAAAQRHERRFAIKPQRVLSDDLPPVCKHQNAANPLPSLAIALLPTVP